MRSGISQITAFASIAAGIIHFSAATEHDNLPVMMAGFLVVGALQVALGGTLLWRRPGQRLIGAAAALMVCSIGLWAVSRTAGLPLLRDGHMEPVGFKDGVTVLLELATLPGLLLLSRDASGLALPSPRFGTPALGAIGCAILALTVPALLADGGHHHSHEEAVALGISGHGGDTHEEGSGSAAAHGDDHPADTADEHHGDAPAGANDSAEAHSGSGHSDHGAGGTQVASLVTDGGHPHGGGGAPGEDGGDHRARSHQDAPRHRGHPHRRPAKRHGHDRGKGKGKGDGGGHEHEHPPADEPENDGPLRQLDDLVPAVGPIPPRR
jgi:hypothetical protein